MNINRKKIIITGSLGLIGFETTLQFLEQGYEVLGIDNNLRASIFKIDTQYNSKLNSLIAKYGNLYKHIFADIREKATILDIFKRYSGKMQVIIHTAAQTSHDWAKKDPFLDFSVNANGTFNLLEAFRTYSPEAVFIFTSTNKVYGDLVNLLPLKEYETRYDLPKKHEFYEGINESFSIDQSTHSLFGVSKASADLLVQEYGRYFGLKTGIFRLGVVAGSGQSASIYQGFLGYIVESIVKENKIKIIGYKGKQVRDIIHASDVARAFFLFSQNPGCGEVFNLGGGRKNNASLLEIISMVSAITNKKFIVEENDNPRVGDHKWWISDVSKFKRRFPKWSMNYNIENIILDIHKHYDFQRGI